MNQALAIVQPKDTAVYQEKAAWELMREQASILITTGFLPQEINTPEKAIAVMMKGRELGIPHMYALSNIAIVKGKPTCSAELMLALIRRDHGPQAMRVKETTNERCTVEWRQQGWPGTQSYTFTIQDAQQAGLTADTWKKYPAAMLRARCISAVARMQFPESISGMYSPGELGETVLVTDEGEVLSGETVPVDTETGEILDERSSGGPGLPPQAELVRPEQFDADVARMRRLHAVAADKGLSHDELHLIAVGRGKASLKDLTAQELDEFTNWLERKEPPAIQKAIDAGRDPATLGAK